MVVYWLINTPLSCLFAFAPFNAGLKGLWLGMMIGMIVMSVAFEFIIESCDWHKAAEDAQERVGESTHDSLNDV